MEFNLAFFMDAAILALLAATVFLAFRLSLSLRAFKESRFEMEGVINRTRRSKTISSIGRRS